MANKCGYLLRYDYNNKTKKIFSFSDIYTNSSILHLIKNDIYNPEIHFFCSCTKKNVSLSVTENNLVQLNPTEHTRECYSQYQHMLYEIKETKKGDLLYGRIIDLHLSLRRDETPTLCTLNYECVLLTPTFGNLDLSTYIGLSNIIAFNKIASDPVDRPNGRGGFASKMEHSLLSQLGICKLRDLQGNYFSINTSSFLNEHVETGKVYFYYGLVIKKKLIRQYMHLTCMFMKKEVVITIPLMLWKNNYSFIENINYKHPCLWFAGFVRIVERTRQSKGSYDSYTHTSYSSKKHKVQEFTLKHGVLFHTNLYGLICFSEIEAEEGNHAMDNGLGLVKPIFPYSRRNGDPLGYHSPLIARSDNRVYYDHFLNKI